jgi:hypothetical protein
LAQIGFAQIGLARIDLVRILTHRLWRIMNHGVIPSRRSAHGEGASCQVAVFCRDDAPGEEKR